MSNKELIKEIFGRLDNNFYGLGNSLYAATDSELAADALLETLYNIGLENLYTREDCVNDEGLWESRFTVKE